MYHIITHTLCVSSVQFSVAIFLTKISKMLDYSARLSILINLHFDMLNVLKLFVFVFLMFYVLRFFVIVNKKIPSALLSFQIPFNNLLNLKDNGLMAYCQTILYCNKSLGNYRWQCLRSICLITHSRPTIGPFHTNVSSPGIKHLDTSR